MKPKNINQKEMQQFEEKIRRLNKVILKNFTVEVVMVGNRLRIRKVRIK